VIIPQKDECEECTAKIFCKSDLERSKERTLLVRDPFGVHPGDRVRIMVKGSVVMTASMLMYGVPLLLFLAALFLGMKVFNQSPSPELYSFALATALLLCYFAGFFFYGKKYAGERALPEIVQYTMHG